MGTCDSGAFDTKQNQSLHLPKSLQQNTIKPINIKATITSEIKDALLGGTGFGGPSAPNALPHFGQAAAACDITFLQSGQRLGFWRSREY
jgi:hypothetical protein